MKLFEDQYVKQRIEKGSTLRKSGINPYSNTTNRNMTNAEFKHHFEYLEHKEEKKDTTKSETIAGRIKFLRLMGKAAFAKVEDESGILQIYFSKDALGEEWFKNAKKLIEVGDIIEAKGYPFYTKMGELSLHVEELKILTKAIAPLPEKYHGIQDKELRYRKRYLDLIMNPDVKESFKIRSKVVSLTRRFFEEKSFLEVETPMLHPIPGGANAKPFITHHNALNVERYLRIAPELYLKRLIVGGFEAVFELNRNFRNEGMDHTHNPEFTMIEFYWAYKTYEDLIEITQEFFDYILTNLDLKKKLPYGDLEIDFSKKFARFSYDESLIMIGKLPEAVTVSKDSAISFIKEKNLPIENPEKMTLGYIKAELFDIFVEDKLIDPTFITDFPVEISPLARRSDEDPNVTERFELFIAGKEIANGFSELNDPIDQYQRFKAQVDLKDSGDDEAQFMDEDYVEALAHGMAPTAGEGIGIDRLVMLLTGNESIRDVLLFPAMKPLHENTLGDLEEKKQEEEK
ncbi:MAG: lysine--tRNA ligase [Campylobacterales bacterium]|nr:lysine--tRNA ligase [Campylobacterales bacterium]